MKRIKILLVVIVAAGIMFTAAALNVHFNTQSENRQVSLAKIEALSGEWSMYDEDEIDLWGSLVYIPVKSYSPPTSVPFAAIRSSSYITVHYLLDLSNITVKIVKSSGQTVYYNVVNPAQGGQLSISLAGLSSGYYSIIFTAPNGSSVYGNFEY